MNHREVYLDQIDNYKETIHAMVGFMNFYRYNDALKTIKDDISVFQGRRFNPSKENGNAEKEGEERYVTPDICIYLPTSNGVVGEVKMSFDRDENHWLETFKQLMSYDDDLKGWPTQDEKVTYHDIVLILHQSRAARVQKYYETKRGTDITFSRPFIMVLFNRSDERRSYYFFQKTVGKLTEGEIDQRLSDGVQVPMEVFVTTYSTIKIYDSKPPLPYLMHLIWENVITPDASENPKFAKLKKNQKLEIEIEIDQIVEELYKGFTFYCLHGESSVRQQRMPCREWVLDACEQLIKSSDAEWLEKPKKIRIFYTKKYSNTLDHFIDSCIGELEMEKQENLFEPKQNKES